MFHKSRVRLRRKPFQRFVWRLREDVRWLREMERGFLQDCVGGGVASLVRTVSCCGHLSTSSKEASVFVWSFWSRCGDIAARERCPPPPASALRPGHVLGCWQQGGLISVFPFCASHTCIGGSKNKYTPVLRFGVVERGRTANVAYTRSEQCSPCREITVF